MATRLWAKVRVGSASECWPFVGCVHPVTGYGQMYVGGRPEGAHRVAFTVTHGAIPDGLFVLHHCDNRKCVNPAHLYAGTHKKNMEDAVARGRFNTPRPNRQRLTDAQCDAVVRLARSGKTQAEVARTFGVSRVLVCMLVSGKRRQYRPQPVRLERTA